MLNTQQIPKSHAGMRIAVDAYHAARTYGGVSRYIRCLSRAMVEQRPSASWVFYRNAFRDSLPAWQPDAEDVTTCSIGLPRSIMQWAWQHWHAPSIECFVGAVDLVHGTHFVLPAVGHAKTVLTVHDLTFLRHPELFKDDAMNHQGYRVELPASIQRADVLIAVSESAKQDLMELMHIPEAKIQCIYEGVQEHFFVQASQAEQALLCQRYGLEKPYLAFVVGAPEPRKNIQRVVQAMQQQDSDVELVLIGDEAAMRSLLYDVPACIRFLGHIPDADLPYILNAALGAVYPSLYEGFGLPILEAMAASVPVLTSTISACPEVAGDAALCVDPYDVDAIAEGMRRIIEDRDWADALAIRACQRARMFSWQKAATETLKVYDQLLSDTKNNAAIEV